MPSRRAVPPSEGCKAISVRSKTIAAKDQKGYVVILAGGLSSPELYDNLLATVFRGDKAHVVTYAGDKLRQDAVEADVARLIKSLPRDSHEVVVIAIGYGASVLVGALRKMSPAERESFHKIIVDGSYGTSTLLKLRNPFLRLLFGLRLHRLLGDRFGGWLLDRMVEPPDIDSINPWTPESPKGLVEKTRRLMRGHSWLLFGDQVRFMMKWPNLTVMTHLRFAYVRCAKGNDIVSPEALAQWQAKCLRMKAFDGEMPHAWPLAHHEEWTDVIRKALMWLRDER